MSIELEPATAALIVVDFQERLCAAMPPAVVEAATRNVSHLLTLAARLGIPVVTTEQYPQGLGPTVEALRGLLPGAAVPKVAFSALREPAAAAALQALERRSAVVVGMETHVCVYQTVRDLTHAGWTVHVPGDAVVSRTKANWRVGLDLCRAVGATVTSAEAVLFDLLKVGQGEAFKEVSRRIR